jgi:hypothetical protein
MSSNKMINNSTASLRAERSNPFLFASFPRRREALANNAFKKEIAGQARNDGNTKINYEL